MKRPTGRCLLVFAGFAALLALVDLEVGAAGGEAGAGRPVSFINDVAPVLKENCFACHDAHKRKGKLDLTTYESLRQGGDGDDPVVPGHPDDSLIYQRIRATGVRRMPPETSGEALPADRVAVIGRWIREGARLDAGLSPKADLLRELRLRWKPPMPATAYRAPIPITALTFTPDGRRLVVSGYYELTLWEVATGALRQRLRTRSERAYAVLFLPDGKLVVAGGRPGQEGDVRAYDIYGPARQVNGVALLDGVNERRVLIRELAETDDAALCLAMSPDGQRLAASGCDHLVRVWDLGGGMAHARLEQVIDSHADWVCGLAFARDGRQVITASRDRTAKRWDLGRRESVQTFADHQNAVYDVAVAPDGKFGVSVGGDGHVRSWTLGGQGGQRAASMEPGRALFKVALHSQPASLATGGADGLVRLWNPDTLVPVRTLPGLADWIYALALSPDGRLLAAGAWNGDVRVWRVADGSLVRAFKACPGLHLPGAASVLPGKR